MPTRIVIRHLTGSKINQVEQFPFDSFPELSIGREPGSAILFDAVRDDSVSRKHAIIKIVWGDPPNFKLHDLGSSNGTFLNGERIAGEIELLPGDAIELGLGGPKFTFDLEPRPGNLVARTRMINAAGSAATRIIEAPLATATAASAQAEQVTRSSVGRNTVMRLISEQRQATSRIGLYALAGILAVIGLVGGIVYYKTQTDVAEQGAQFVQQSAAQEAKNQELVAKVQQQQKDMGLSPSQIVDKFANATVLVNMQWRLYDRETGRPLFHKTVSVPGAGLLPAYVEWKGSLYRWLTTEDELHSNYKVGAGGAGTGFIVNEQGLAITNKHVAAGWLINYNQFSPYEKGRGVLFEAQEAFYRSPEEYSKKNKGQVFDVSANPARFRALVDWLPEEGGPVFANSQPVIIGQGAHTFEGRNEELSVRFPGSRVDVNARLVLPSPDADAALIRIDATQSLSAISIAQDDTVKEGERVIVLGYPAFTAENQAVVTTTEAGELRHKVETIPQPTVTEGNISNISLPVQQVGNVTIRGTMGHSYQLTVPSWKGNSGGPVFNSDGVVVGLYTYGSARETVTFAVPIMYARDLMKMQRTF
jgi:serine protease Do